MDLNFERYLEEWIKQDKMKVEINKNLIKNEMSNLLNYIIKRKTKFLQDDCYYYKEDSTLETYGKTITAVVEKGIDILHRNSIDILDKEEYFHTEKFYLTYNEFIFSAKRVHGQGSFCEIELLDSKEMKKTLTPILKYTDILGEVK